MKIYIVICLVFLANVLGKPITDEEREQHHKLNQECGKKSGVDEATLKKIETYQEYPETDKMMVHAKCIMKGLGVVDDEGKINVEAMSNFLKKAVPAGKENDIIKKCNVNKGEATKTAFYLGKCVFTEINALKA